LVLLDLLEVVLLPSEAYFRRIRRVRFLASIHSTIRSTCGSWEQVGIYSPDYCLWTVGYPLLVRVGIYYRLSSLFPNC
jgi:hypothetical protein